MRRAVAAGAAAAVIVILVVIVVALAGRGGGVCFAGDATSASPFAAPGLVERAARVPTTGQAAVETVGGAMLGARTDVTAEAGSIVSLSGWAVDPVAHTVGRAVFVDVDGVLVRADTCIPRSDVAQFFKLPAYERSGYAARLQILPGVHDIAIDVLSADGKTLYTGVRRLRIVAKAPVRPVAAAAVNGAFSAVDGVPVSAAAAPDSFAHPLGVDLLLAGWIVDASYPVAAPVRSVDVMIDGRVVDRASYGAARPDVAKLLNAPGALHIGFTARVLTDGLAPGRHHVSLRGVVADGRSALLAPAVTIDLEAPPSGVPVTEP